MSRGGRPGRLPPSHRADGALVLRPSYPKTGSLSNAGLERLGVPGPVVSAVANHAPTSVTKVHYSFHDFAEEKREALTNWGDHVEKLNPATKAKVVKIRRTA